jgi:hypothetical protein
VSPEVVLAAVYAATMLAGALLLEWLSAHTHRRALRYRTAGFAYDETHDHWVCPQGEHLWPHEFDRERRLIRYRAKAHVCNRCPLKGACTDSDRGREIVRPLDPWPHSEAGRFHRVLALLMVCVAGLVLLAAAARHPGAAELALVAGMLALTVGTGVLLARDLRRHPANFPAATGAQGLRMVVTGADGVRDRNEELW